MQLSAKALAAILNGTTEGDPSVEVNRPSKIEEGGEGSISFLGNPKYEEYAYQSTASILLVPNDFQPRQPIKPTLIRVANVYEAVALLLERFGADKTANSGISDKAWVHPDARLGQELSVGAFSVIEEGSSIGNKSLIASQVYIGRKVSIGSNCRIYPGARILDDTQIGDHCIIHANVVIGGDGFGFAPNAAGEYQKITHVGNVIIEDHVEIGAGTTIDRATMGSTIIRRGVKLDNLIQIAHNVEIGENTVIAAQAGIAGSTKIGKSCRIGGQVGFAGHLVIADGTQIQAQSGIASSVKTPNQRLFGSPAIDYQDFLRSHIVFKQLPDLFKRLARLEKKDGNA